jgi:hypothetical protein
MFQKQKGLVVYCHNVLSLYLIQINVVSLKYGVRAEKWRAACQDVTETKGVSDELRKPCKNLCR